MIQHQKMKSQEFEHPFLAVTGPLGVGKTTVAKLVAAELGYHLLEERPELNPFVADATKDPARWAFKSEVTFLTLDLEQNKEAQEIRWKQGLVDDTPTLQNVYSYGRALLKGDEWKIYHNLYKAYEPQLMKPSLIVCLQARVMEVMSRIRERDRNYEGEIKAGYIRYLTLLNYLWIWRSGIPTVYIKTDHLNIVDDAEAKQRMMDTIKKRL